MRGELSSCAHVAVHSLADLPLQPDELGLIVIDEDEEPLPALEAPFPLGWPCVIQ